MTDEASGGFDERLDQSALALLLLPAKWLRSTKWLQETIYGYEDPKDLDTASIANYIDWNQVAAVQELAELREEFSWKPWATDEPFVNRERIKQEAVDTLHFIGNILHGAGITDEEFWTAYRAKQEKNIRRATSGTYSARKGGIAEGSESE